MNERIKEIAIEAGYKINDLGNIYTEDYDAVCNKELNKFAELIVRECIDKIEAYQIPVGNSAAGEMACKWTHEALKEIRDNIKEHFGIE